MMTCFNEIQDGLHTSGSSLDVYNMASNYSNITLNGTTGSHSRHCILSPECRLVRSVEFGICILLGVAGFIGNAISVFVLQRQRIKTSNVFLLQLLCIVDSLLMITTTIVSIQYTWEFVSLCLVNSTFRGLVIITFDLFQFTSNWLLVQLAVDRYIAICHPFSASRWCTVSKAKWFFLMIITISTILTIPRAVEFFSQANFTRLNSTYSIINILFRYIIQIVILLIINTKLIFVIRKAHETEPGTVQSLRDSSAQSTSLRHANSVTINLIVVVLIFLVCGTCRGVYFILWSTFPQVFTKSIWHYLLPASITNILMVFNSSINFIVYCLFYKRFRSTVAEMCCKNKQKSSRTDVSMVDGRSVRTTILPVWNGKDEYL